MINKIIVKLDKKQFTKNIAYEIASIYKQSLLINNGVLSLMDNQKILNLINYGTFFKKTDILSILEEKFRVCEILPLLIKPKDFNKEICIDMNKGVVCVENRIICEINNSETIRNLKECINDDRLGTFHFNYYPFPQGIDLEFKDSQGYTVHIDEYDNVAFDLHVQCEKIYKVYSDISDEYNLFIMPSIYNGSIKNKDVLQIHSEIITNFDDENGINHLIITPENINQHLDTESALEYLYKNTIYSSPAISSFEIFKKFLESIKNYIDGIYTLFSSGFNTQLELSDFCVYMQYKPIDPIYRNVAEGEFEVKIKNFIKNEEMTVSVSSLDIAYNNQNKILRHYYKYNQDLKTLISIDDFINNTEDALKSLIMYQY